MALTARRRGLSTGCFLNERIGPQLLPCPLLPTPFLSSLFPRASRPPPIFTSPDISKHFSSPVRTAASLFIGRILLEGTDGPGREQELATLVLCDVNRFFLFLLFKRTDPFKLWVYLLSSHSGPCSHSWSQGLSFYTFPCLPDPHFHLHPWTCWSCSWAVWTRPTGFYPYLLCVYMTSSPVIVFSSLPDILPLKGAPCLGQLWLCWSDYLCSFKIQSLLTVIWKISHFFQLISNEAIQMWLKGKIRFND